MSFCFSPYHNLLQFAPPPSGDSPISHTCPHCGEVTLYKLEGSRCIPIRPEIESGK